MYCFKCGTEVHDGDRFCRACGTSLAAAGTPRKSRAVPALLAVIALLGALLVYGLCTWQPREAAEPEAAVSEETDALVRQAIHHLKAAWRQEYSRLEPGYADGYMEIIHTRVITVAPNDLDFWRDITCVVEFQLFSDFLGGAPYYANTGIDDTVTFYADGHCEAGSSPFRAYGSKTFSYQFDWIEEIQDLGTAYNGAWYLK